MQESGIGIIYQELKKTEDILNNLREVTGNELLTLHVRKLLQEVKGVQLKVIEEAVKEVADTYQTQNTFVTAKQKISWGSEQKDITLSEALALIKEVEKKATAMGISVVLAVYNSAANPVAIHSMDNSYIASFDIAANKAYTCAALKRSTISLKSLSQPGKELYGIQHTNQGRIIIIGGGEPLNYNGRLIGALGVSGGTEAQDTALAEFGKNILEEVLL
ncbi:hypothetical protein acsn021_21690 [Anaerocolumna cellulosilytica]|uniref:Uncharacterized protein n=1 Tax=Anaerocolumna cellulosilytica TaxID=433286 RepID=A0A6S6R5A8_9FIRM|nr:heme-binding protein [Anaerocolumna cellulosilytica]MBB5194188.1 uncharacterized protein GlcG (DUF336 family) [Anaerocolumna cellulosilytica]BCJ94600.1 hypothetical protein acsn021_21690 [Anaerocolumna cellulosilytica]